MKHWFEESKQLKYLYKKDESYTDDRLTEIDKENITVIKLYEDAKKAGKSHNDCVVNTHMGR